MQGNTRTDTRHEIVLRSLLHRRGLRFRKDFPISVGTRSVRPDLVFTGARVAVFLDGCYWHYCPEHRSLPKTNTDFWRAKFEQNVDRDRQSDRLLSDAGWLVLRYWEHEDLEDVVESVEANIRRRTAECNPTPP